MMSRLFFILMIFFFIPVMSCNSSESYDDIDTRLRRINKAIGAREKSKKNNLPVKNRREWKILLVHSYLNDYRWVREIEAGVGERMDGKDYYGKRDPAKIFHRELKIFYMDTKNHTDPAWKLRKGKEALALVREWNPDIIIASDDNAQEHFARHLKGSSVPVVFCGVNKDPMVYGYIDSLERPGHNVTGLTEDVNFHKTLFLAKSLVPGARKAYILGDNSPTNQGVLDRLMPAFSGAPLEITGYKLTDRWEVWKDQVRSLQGKVDVIVYPHYHTLKDAKGRPISHNRVLSWTLKNSKIPDFTFWNFGVVDGILGSVSAWGKAHGYEAADIAVRILEGREKPGSIPIKTPLVGTIILNRERAKMLGIQIPFALLADAVLVNQIGASL